MAQESKLVARLENVIRQSIEKTLKDAKRPFGLFLSGGIDSGLLAALSKPDVVFTCRFRGKKFDEFSDAVKTAKHLKLKQIVIEPTKKDLTHLKDAVRMFHPTTHFSLLPLYLLFKKAKEQGIKTILSGEGPDEYLGGYASYTFITYEQKLYEQKELANYHHALDKFLGSPADRFARILGQNSEKVKKYWKKKSLLSNMGYADLKLRGIEEMELALAKGFGMKLLYPYMTKEMERFCFEQVPDEMKIKGFTTKYIERLVAEKYIPTSVVWRKNKMGGPVAPIATWLGEKDEFSKTKYVALQEKLWSV